MRKRAAVKGHRLKATGDMENRRQHVSFFRCTRDFDHPMAIPEPVRAAFLTLLFVSIPGCDRRPADSGSTPGTKAVSAEGNAPANQVSVEQKPDSGQALASEKEADMEQTLLKFTEELKNGPRPSTVRDKVLELARHDWSALVNALIHLHGEEHSKIRAITASVLSFRAGELDFETGAGLMEKIQPHLTDFSGGLEQCIKKWTRDGDTASVLKVLDAVNSKSYSADGSMKPLALYAHIRINTDADKVFEVIKNAPAELRDESAEAYSSAASRVFNRNLHDLHDRLIQTVMEGDVSAATALITAAVKMSAVDPGSYAPKLEQYRNDPVVYDNLTFGFIQNVARVDSGSAEA